MNICSDYVLAVFAVGCVPPPNCYCLDLRLKIKGKKRGWGPSGAGKGVCGFYSIPPSTLNSSFSHNMVIWCLESCSHLQNMDLYRKQNIVVMSRNAKVRNAEKNMNINLRVNGDQKNINFAILQTLQFCYIFLLFIKIRKKNKSTQQSLVSCTQHLVSVYIK